MSGRLNGYVIDLSAVRFTDYDFASDVIPPMNRWAIVSRPLCGLISYLRNHKLFVVIEAFEDVADVVDGFKAAAETKLHHVVARVLLR